MSPAVAVQDLGGEAVALGVGDFHSCVIIKGGNVKCWGYGHFGQLGNAFSTYRSYIPVDVQGLGGEVVEISLGHKHTCALMEGGVVVKCWGWNEFGQIGDGSTNNNRYTPSAVQNLGGEAVALGLGNEHTCALIKGGSVRCWGRNEFGPIGDGSTTSRPTPVDVQDLDEEVIGLAAGDFHTCVLLKSGHIKCWGQNYYGAVGDGSNSDQLSLVSVDLST